MHLYDSPEFAGLKHTGTLARDWVRYRNNEQSGPHDSLHKYFSIGEWHQLPHQNGRNAWWRSFGAIEWLARSDGDSDDGESNRFQCGHKRNVSRPVGVGCTRVYGRQLPPRLAEGIFRRDS